MVRKVAAIGAIAVLALTGCETTQSLSKEEKAALLEQQRQHELALLDRIQGAEEACYELLRPMADEAAEYRAEETFGFTGAIFVTEQFYPEVLEPVVNESGIDDSITIRYVFADSPAARAGLRAGDRLVLLNGRKVPTGSNGAIFALRKLKRRLLVEEPNEIVVERNGEELSFEVEAYSASYYGLVIVPYSNFEIMGDGDAVWISLAEVERLQDTNELAYLCSFALAQNVMRQAKMRGKNSFLGQVVDVAAMVYGVNTGGLFGSMGRNAYKAGFDVEADLIALYLLAVSGYPIEEYPNFWERRLKRSTKKDELTAVQAERVEFMGKAITEIRAKQEAGEIVHPTEYLSGEFGDS